MSFRNYLGTILIFVLVALVSSCGGSDGGSSPAPPDPPSPPGPALLAFTDGDGRPDLYSIATETTGAHADKGYIDGCLNCIRATAVAQDAEAAASAMATTTLYPGISSDFYLPKLQKVNFATSSVIVFDRAVGGTYMRLTLTAVEDHADRLRIRSELCAVPDPYRNSTSFDGFIVIPKRNKPAEFAPSDTTGLPPPPHFPPDFTLGQCRS